MLPGEYNIEKENIIAENIKVISLSSDTENYSRVNISSNTIFDCKYFDTKGVKFTIDKNNTQNIYVTTHVNIVLILL